MEKQFVPYELAVKLKELGFDEKCLGFYNDYRELHMNHTYDLFYLHLKAPLWQQAFDWFREKHSLEYSIVNMTPRDKPERTLYVQQIYDIYLKLEFEDYVIGGKNKFEISYESARLACLEKLIELTTPQLEDK